MQLPLFPLFRQIAHMSSASQFHRIAHLHPLPEVTISDRTFIPLIVGPSHAITHLHTFKTSLFDQILPESPESLNLFIQQVHYMPNSIHQTCIPYSSGEHILLILNDPLHYLFFPTSTFNIFVIISLTKNYS